MKPLKEAQTLEAIDDHWSSHGYAPSIRDLAATLNLSPTATCSRLKLLRAMGKVNFVDRQPRTLKVAHRV